MAVKVVPPRGLFKRSDSDLVGDVVVHPVGVVFATQDSDEQVFVLLRRAWITNFGWAFKIAFYGMLPLVIIIGLNALGLDLSHDIPVSFFYVTPLIFYSFLLTFMIIKFNEWYYNVIIITNKRILLYKFKAFSTYKVAEANLANIQDVSQSTVGVFPSIFNYGDLLVQTAGERVKFRITNVPRPTWVRNILVDLANLSRNPEP